MIPPALLPRLSACSPAELRVLWRAFAHLLTRIEIGRPTYGTEPGRDKRDYVKEALAEVLDATMYIAMHEEQTEYITSGDAAVAQLREAGLLDAAMMLNANGCAPGIASGADMPRAVVVDPSGPVWVMPEEKP